MSLCEISVKRRIAMCSFLLMLIFLGIRMYERIAIDSLPKFDIPYIQITAIYPGASPEEVETDIAKKIEDAVASLDGLKHTTSMCLENVCAITLEFELGTNVDLMIHEVREKLNQISDDLPETVEQPKLGKININSIPVVTLYLMGNKTIDELYDYADEYLSDKFASLKGVAEVSIHGGNEVQLHILLDRDKLAESNLTIPEIINRIKTSNVKIPAGRVKENGTEMSISFDAEFNQIQQLKELEIGNKTGNRIYLGDIADIKLMSKEIRQQSYLNGNPAVKIEIVKKSDSNAVEVINLSRAKYNEIVNSGTLQGGLKLEWVRDSGSFIHSSIDDAWASVVLGIVLTAVILFLFLHDIRSTFIVVISMPVSIVISFIAMKILNYTFDMMTLVSLGCSAGVLVTNSIVVLENIFKRMDEGMNPKQAAIKGSEEIVSAVAASALTNVVVFVPMALMTSVVGLLISPFAGVMVVATMASLFISFTLTPILAAYFFRKGRISSNNFMRKIFVPWDFFYQKLEDLFMFSVFLTKKFKWIVLLITVAISSFLLYVSLQHMSVAFIPTNDKNEINIRLEFPVNMAIEESQKRTLEIMAKLGKHKEIKNIGATVGYLNGIPGQVSEGVYIAGLDLFLIQKKERASVFEFAKILRKELSEEKNVRFSVNIPAATGMTGAECSAYITGPDFEVLQAEGVKAMKVLKESGIATEIDTSMRAEKPRISIFPDRTILKNIGVSETLLGTSVLTYFEGLEVGTYKVGTRTYDMRLKVTERQGFSSAYEITIGSLNGSPLNIDTVADIEQDPVSASMIREDKERSVWLYCNPTAQSSLGEVVNLLRKEIGSKLPQGYKLSFFGQAEMMENGTAEFSDVFIIAIVLTYLLIAAIMESWSGPFLILFTIPLGFIGLFYALHLSGKALSMVGMLGGVMMIGIVVNNAILIMDDLNANKAAGMPKHDAMIQALKNKFRPIVMTSLASVIGMLPMAFGTGIGSELRSSCGIAVVGGLTYSAIMTLYLIPALYFIFSKNKVVPKRGE